MHHQSWCWAWGNAGVYVQTMMPAKTRSNPAALSTADTHTRAGWKALPTRCILRWPGKPNSAMRKAVPPPSSRKTQKERIGFSVRLLSTTHTLSLSLSSSFFVWRYQPSVLPSNARCENHLIDKAYGECAFTFTGPGKGNTGRQGSGFHRSSQAGKVIQHVINISIIGNRKLCMNLATSLPPRAPFLPPVFSLM